MGGNYLVVTVVGILLTLAGSAGWITYYVEHGAAERQLRKTEAEQTRSSERLSSPEKELDVLQPDRAALREHDSLQPQRTSRQDQHSSLQGERAALRHKYASLQREHAALQREHTALQRDTRTLRTRSGRLETRLADAVEARDALSSRLDSARSEQTRLTGELEAMQEQRLQLAERMDSGEIGQDQLSAWIATTTEQIQTKESELRSAQRQIDNLRRQRDEMRTRLESAKTGQDELRTRLKATSERIRKKESTLRNLQEQIDKLLAQRDELHMRLDSAKSGRDELRTRLETTAERIRAKEAELQGLQRRIGESTEELDTANAEIASLAEEVERQKAARNRQGERFAELKEQLETRLQSKEVQIEQLRDDLTVIRMGSDILFNVGSAELRPSGAEALRLIADVLKEFPDRDISLEGHTDNVPIGESLQSTFPSNWELSAARAAHAARFLQYGAGIDPGRLRIVGYGEHRPVASNKRAEGKMRNRRIEIMLLPRVDNPTVARDLR